MSRAASGPRVGKRVGGALYVHRCAVDHLDVEAGVRLRAAAGRVADDWNVAKVEDRAVSLLLYEDLDANAFPCLLHGVRIDGDKVVRTDYSGRDNPPVLHRKELLLSHDDARAPLFASLTRAAEEHGLFAASHRIGTRRAWAARIAEAGLRLDGHSLVPTGAEPVEVARHRTAIVRNRLSAPMQALVRHDFVRPGDAILDYGCGQGDDVQALVDGGVAALGWDPHFRPDTELSKADVVNLGFVLNVIETQDERIETLRKAWSYCGRVLAVAVMVAGHRPTVGLKPYGDGFLTSRGTFQRYFTPVELKDIVRDALGVEGFVVGLGVVFAFRDAADERDFLFRRQVRRSERPVAFRPPPRERTATVRQPLADRIRPTLETLWETMLAVGRPPVADEVPADVSVALRSSNVSLARAVAWCEDAFGRDNLDRAARQRREDLLLYFALGAFTKSVALSDLASSLQRDARIFFGSVAKAKVAAMTFLFSLGETARVRDACERAVAAGTAYWNGSDGVHFRQTLRGDLSLELRGLVGCASVLYGDLDEVDVIHVDADRSTVSMYYIDDFDAKLPLVKRLSRIDLRRQTIGDQAFSEADRRVFLLRSAYAATSEEAQERAAVEARIRGTCNLRDNAVTVKHADLVRVIRDGARLGDTATRTVAAVRAGERTA